MENTGKRFWIGRHGLGQKRASGHSDEHFAEVDEILTTTVTEGDRRELEQGNAARVFADRRSW